MSQVTSESILTTKEIVEQAIKDYHKQILPYLNGEFPISVAERFAEGNLYSTDEKIIGQWIDGKPIYQKTFSGVLSTSGDESIAHNISNVDVCIERKGFIGYDNATIPFGFYNGEVFNNMFMRKTTFEFRHSRLYTNCPYKVTVLYTKTTDEPVSFGTDTYYSTEEKVIGTWIDGSLIYQIVRDTPFSNVSLIPTMSSNTSDICEVSSIGDYQSNYSYKAFDNDDTTHWASTTNNHGYLDVHFFTAQTVAKISLKPRKPGSYASVKDFEIWGSNDNFATHDVLLSATCQNSSDIQNFDLTTMGRYSYYRLNILNVWTTDAMSAAVIQLNLIGKGQSDITILDTRILNGKYVYQYTKTTD